MSAKRVKVREEKRKRKFRNQMLIIAGIAAVVLVAAGIAFYGFDQYSKSYIMTFNGNKISVDDFKIFSLFATGAEDVKSEALDEMLKYLVIDQAAKDNGITLTEEEQAETVSYASNFRSYFSTYGIGLPANVKDSRVAEILSMQWLYDKLVDQYTANYVVDEADFNSRLDDYKENSKIDYIDTQVKYIITDSMENMVEAQTLIESGESFDEVLKQYSVYYDEESGIAPISLRSMGFESDAAERIMALEEGQVSGIETMNEQFALLYVDSITIPTEEELSETFREQYLIEKKVAIFEEILSGWKSSADYVLNQKAYDAA